MRHKSSAKRSTKQPLFDVSMVAIIYCRVSTKGQTGGASLETQEEGARRYCTERGYSVLAVEHDVHSGASMDRPGLQAALDTIRSDQASILVAHSLDRLSRNQTHQAVILHQVEEQAEGRVEFVTEKVDNTPHGRFLRNMLGFAAEIEHEKIQERTERGKRRRAENGAILPGATALYGYEWGPERTREGRLAKVRLVSCAETAPVVQRIFREYVSGKSVRAIVRDLEADGILTPSQYHARRRENGSRPIAPVWNRESIRRILTNSFYKGEPEAYRYHDFKERRVDSETGVTRIIRRKVRRARLATMAGMEEIAAKAGNVIALASDACPPLVDAATWLAAQEQLERNKAEATLNNKYAKDQLLRAGFARCAYCGRNMIARRNGQTMRYVCTSRYGNYGSVTRYCSGGAPTVSVHLLDTDIWSKLLLMLRTNVLLLAQFEHLARRETSVGAREALQARLDSFGATLATLTRRRRNLLLMLADAPDDEMFAELDAQVKVCSERLHKTQVERDELAERIEQTALTDVARRLLPRLPESLTRGQPVDETLETACERPSGNDAARQEALMRVHAQWAAILADAGREFTYEEKRALLRFLGVRVDVYRKNDKRPDGTHWELHTSLNGINDIHKLRPVEPSVARSENTANTEDGQDARIRYPQSSHHRLG